MRVAIIGALLALGLLGCAATEPDRQTKLLAMASDEAQQITDPKDRLTRQLNFANEQMQRGHATESRQSLAHAAQTLRDSKTEPLDPLDPQIRIAGWVSISELSREADDRPNAESASQQAVATLNALEPVSERSEYVVGVANEVKALRGDAAAAKLLVEGAEWTTQIEGTKVRRLALTEIADGSFACNDYDAGLAALRTDPDAAWRSDTLATLAGATVAGTRSLDWISNVGNAAVPGSIAANPTDADSVRFNSKRVDFHSVFQQK